MQVPRWTVHRAETAEGRAAIEAWFQDYSADELKGPPKVLTGGDHSIFVTDKVSLGLLILAAVLTAYSLWREFVKPAASAEVKAA